MTPDSPRHAGAPRRVLSIAWREFRTTVLTKGFLFSALVFPLLMAGVSLLLPILMATSVQPMQGAILVDAPAAATDGSFSRPERDACVSSAGCEPVFLQGTECRRKI